MLSLFGNQRPALLSQQRTPIPSMCLSAHASKQEQSPRAKPVDCLKIHGSTLQTLTSDTKKDQPTTSDTGSKGKMKVCVYRYDSEKGERYDSYEIDPEQIGGSKMVLDLLDYIAEKFDPSLSFRKSCCEGVCGSCGMSIKYLLLLLLLLLLQL